MSALDVLFAHRSPSDAIVDAETGARLTYPALRARIDAQSGWLRETLGRGLVFIAADNSIDAIVTYLACLAAECPVCLLDAGAPDAIRSLVAQYRPALLARIAADQIPDGYEPVAPESGVTGCIASAPSAVEMHPRLALLLTTSGSTGSPKLVRLSLANVLNNALSISNYLGLNEHERSVQSLPMHYSYGLSLINSHFCVGGTVVLTPHSFMRPEFWRHFSAERCTSFAGVPYMYETLQRLRFDPAKYDSLRTMTQAGGALKPDVKLAMLDKLEAARKTFVVMYGQTEATARISYVPAAKLRENLTSIGIAIPGGSLELQPIADTDGATELVYRGKNVMLGYADDAASLALGDALGGVLQTGDIAVQNADGLMQLVGRLKRFAKLYGRRVSLDDIERFVETQFARQSAVIEVDNGVAIFLVDEQEPSADTKKQIGGDVARWLSVPPASVVIRSIPAVPLTANGKRDYKALSI
jgi:acyl-CoA synthetase (AMP-forming)/AMP-acid ligase II